MLKKYLLLSGLFAVLTACDSPTVDNGPRNTSTPTPPSPAPEYTPQWSFDTLESISAWSIEYDKYGTDNDPATAIPSELDWHKTQYALQIEPNWGGKDVADNEDRGGWDNITVYGTLEEPMNLEYATIYLSLYYPKEHLGNPWGTEPYWGNSTHFLGTQYVVIDSNGNRAYLNSGNGKEWLNSYEIASTDWQRTDSKARKADSAAYKKTSDTLGLWFDLKIESGIKHFPFDDNASDFDLTSVVSFGVKISYAHNLAANNPVEWAGASDKYIYIDDVAIVPYVGEPPVVVVEPPPALEELAEFGLPIFRDSLESGFNSSWRGQGGTWNWASDYGVKSGLTSIALSYEEAGAIYKIGGPDETLNLSSVKTFDFSAWVGAKGGDGSTKLFVSMCDCDDGIEVVLKEGEWNDISIPVTDFGKDFLYGAIRIKNNSSGSRIIYLDDVGFDKVPDSIAPVFSVPVYADGMLPGFNSAWGGWGGTWDWASVSQKQDGTTSIEASYEAGKWGALQIGADDLDLTTLSTFHFSAYGAVGTGTTSLFISMCDCDDGIAVDVVEGQWTNITMKVADFVQTTLTGAMRIKNNTADAKVIYFDNIGFDLLHPPEFVKPVYHEGVQPGFNDGWGGWGGTWDWASTEMPQTGELSIKASYEAEGWGALQIGSNDLDLTTLSTFHFSAYGAEGTGTTSLFISMCDCDDGVAVTIEEGKWTRVEIALSEFPQTVLTGAMRIKNNQVDAKVVYFDDIGFDLLLPPSYDTPIYYDAFQSGYNDGWGGWGGTWEWYSTEMPYHGDTSIKLMYKAGDWGAMQIGVNADVDLTVYSTFHFAAYGDVGTGTTSLFVSMCDCDDGIAVDVEEGKWTRIEIPVADFAKATLTGAMRIKNNTADAKVIYVDDIGFMNN